MKPLPFILTYLIILFSAPGAHAEIDPTGKDAPPEIVDRAKELVARKDFAGIESMIAQIDAQYGKNHGPDYFRSLLGIRCAISGNGNSPKIDYPSLWLDRKLLWKILLTPYSRIEDALDVQQMRNVTSQFGTPIPLASFDEDRDQFIALRRDEVAMLRAYADSLRARINPGYQPKPERGFINGIVLEDEKTRAARIAGEKRQEPKLTRNKFENAEQKELGDSLTLLSDAVTLVITEEFSWPPKDDQTVADLLDAFLFSPESRESILSELSASRSRYLAELKAEKANRKEPQQKAP